MKHLIKPVVLSLALLSAGAANAADTMTSALGGQVVYDATTNLSWIANANLAATNTFGVSGINANGSMNWNTAQNWITAMDASKYLGYSDWRLPTSDTCAWYNCTGSQMGNLFYNGLGQVAGQSITTTHNANYSLFNNVQSYLYWSGTEYVKPYVGGCLRRCGGQYAWNPDLAWYFRTDVGYQNALNVNDGVFALAVRPGQVAAVPEPSTTLLFGVGLLAMIGVVRRRLALR